MNGRWLYDHRDELDLYFSTSSETLASALLRDHDIVLSEAMVTVPLSAEDFAKATAIAASSGRNTDIYLAQMVHEALQSKRAA